MSLEAKFVQIAAVGYALFALDTDGVVWAYHSEIKQWVQMPTARVPIPDYGAPSAPANSTGD